MSLYAIDDCGAVKIIRTCAEDHEQTVQYLKRAEAATLLKSLAEVLWEQEQNRSQLYQMLWVIQRTLATK